MMPEGRDSLEIAHVLFTDIVGYSLLPMDRQKDDLAEFQQIVHDSPRVQSAEAAGELLSLPTGDGMALVFLRDPIAPAQCALELAEGLRKHPHLKVRMGVNSGPVYRVSDFNANANVAGHGINMAQRVMDCGDSGHILLSESSADLLLELTQWAPRLADLGDIEVKHGVTVHLYNLTADGLGNPALPRRIRNEAAARAKRRKLRAAWAAALLLVLAGLGWWGWRSRGPAEEPSIAVLPFEDHSQEKNQAYFAEGLAEELLNGLSRLPGLRVAARSSSFRFKDGSADYKEIREKLHVAAILQGSVRKQGNQARISVQLIETSDGFQLWADSFNKDLSDILGVQQDIARAVVGKLKVTMLAGNGPVGNTNASAYDAYLQGLYLARRGSRESLEKAVEFYEQSLQLGPNSARAQAALGSALTDQAQHSYIPREEGYRKAREALDRALTLDPTLASPNSTLAWIAMYHDWNWNAAAAYSRKALELDPGSAVAMNTAATLAMVLGHRDESIALYQRAIRIDPLSSAKLINQGLVLYYSGRFTEAETSLRKALSLAPDREDVHMYLALIRLAQGKSADAMDEAGKETNPDHRLFATALAQFALGNTAASNESLAKLVSSAGADSPCMIAEAHAWRGQSDMAFLWLDKAFEARDSELTEIKSNALFARIASDPRFAALVRKIGLPA